MGDGFGEGGGLRGKGEGGRRWMRIQDLVELAKSTLSPYSVSNSHLSQEKSVLRVQFPKQAAPIPYSRALAAMSAAAPSFFIRAAAALST